MSQVDKIDHKALRSDLLISTIKGPRLVGQLKVLIVSEEVPCGTATTITYCEEATDPVSGVSYLGIVRQDQEIKVKEGIIASGISKL